MSEGWCTIESDPGVFTELVREMGVSGVQIEELWSLDKESLNALRPVYGLIFLFKWRAGEKDVRPVETQPPPGGKAVFFAKQVINNACATQAILSILLNREDVPLGSELQNLKEFTAAFPPDLKGASLSNSEVIRKAHNSFARTDLIEESARAATSEDELYHFISYVPVGGYLYELDGLKEGPINLGACSADGWLDAVAPAIQERVERYAASEIRFNLMAVIRSREELAAEQLADAQARKEALLHRIAACGAPDDAAQLDAIDAELASLADKLAAAREQAAGWRAENERRKHTFVPFIFNFLKVLAESGKMRTLVERAKQASIDAALGGGSARQ